MDSIQRIDHSQAAGRDLHVATDDALMAERVKYLEAIVKEKDKRISELKERIDELKNKYKQILAIFNCYTKYDKSQTEANSAASL